MATVFSEEQSVFFVGGRGDKSGRIADAGGCTKAWWDAEVASSDEATAMAKLMSATGGPIVTENALAYTIADDRITEGGGTFAGIEVGMVVYVIENPVPEVDVDTGRYKITDVDVAGDWIECAGINGTADASVDIEIGGAFDTLENALDETSANNNSVHIHTNLSEVLAATLSFSVGGNVVNNTFKRVNGYNTVPGDMDRGGAYYETPFEILRNGSIDLSKCVTFDANGGAFDVMTLGASIENCVLENIHFTGADNSTKRGIGFADANSLGVLLHNCRFSDMFQGCNATVVSMVFISCYSHSDVMSTPHAFKAHSGLLMACVANLAVGTLFVNFIGVPGVVSGCLVVGGAWGARAQGAGSAAVIIGNTFYGQSAYGARSEETDSFVVLNNIFCLAPGAKGLLTNIGSIILNDYNCFIATDGTPLTVGESGSGDEVPEIGAHSIEVDPLFVDAANNDFRLKPLSTCIGAGKRSMGEPTNIGAFTDRPRHVYGLQRGVL